MFVINIPNLPIEPIDQFVGEVKLLANHIRERRALVHERALGILRGVEQEFSNVPPSLEVIEDLGKIITMAKKKGLGKKLHQQIQIISGFRRKIIALRTPILPKDVIEEVLSKLPVRDMQKFQLVSYMWWSVFPRAQIRAINERKRPFHDIFPKKNATEILNWLEKNLAHRGLEFADFTNVNDFDNDCLQRLTNLCPNLKYLDLRGSKISGDALKHLVHTNNLQSLSISNCHQLETDALKHLEHTRNLKRLNIVYCTQLETDALKHLEHTNNLQRLNINWCRQLEPDALKHLEHTNNLQYLKIAGYLLLEADALKHLKHTNNLQSLIITSCTKLEADTLKHLKYTLKHTMNLQHLNIVHCNHLDRSLIPRHVDIV